MRSSSSAGGACRGRRGRGLGGYLVNSFPAVLGSASADPSTRQSLKASAFAAASLRGTPLLGIRVLKPFDLHADSECDSRLGLTAISQARSFEKGRRTTPPFSLRSSRIR